MFGLGVDMVRGSGSVSEGLRLVEGGQGLSNSVCAGSRIVGLGHVRSDWSKLIDGNRFGLIMFRASQWWSGIIGIDLGRIEMGQVCLNLVCVGSGLFGN